MADAPLSIVLIPGLGADAGVYRFQREALGSRVVVPDWIEPRWPRESLESYAKRFARVIEAMPNVTRPYYIGGNSFGGMIAGEICELPWTHPAGLLLIGSCTHRSQVRYLFRIGEMVVRFTPRGLIKGWMNKLVPDVFGWLEGCDPHEARVMHEVTFRTDVRLLKWGGHAIRSWRSLAASRVPIFQAHGERDFVIPMRRQDLVPGRDLIVPGGRHLIHLTHAPEVNAWLERVTRA